MLIPTAVVALTLTFTTFVLEWVTKRANYDMALDMLLFSVGLILLMLPGLLASALWGKPLCSLDDIGIYYKNNCIRWSNITHVEYVYGYTRYHGDHSYLMIAEGNTKHRLPRGPIWLPLIMKRYTTDFKLKIPHLKRHFKRGIVIGIILSAIVVCVYLL